MAATQPGSSGSDLYRVAARAYAEAGFENEERLHHQGGATGYRTRDWVAHPACRERVQVNQAFAWNPSVTGTKVEDTCIAFADRKSTRLNSSHLGISYAVFCLKKKTRSIIDLTSLSP